MVIVKQTAINKWSVNLNGRAYTATYDPNTNTFPLDRWTVQNSRWQQKPCDNKVAGQVVKAIADTRRK